MNHPQQNPEPMYTMDSAMQEEDSIDLLQYWRVIRKNLYSIIGLAVTVGILAMLVVNSMTPIYSAVTKVSIERASPSTGASMNSSWYTLQKYPGTQYEIIKSRAVAEKVVENLKLTEHPFFDKKKESSGFSFSSLFSFKGESELAEELLSEEEKLKKKKDMLTSMVQEGISVKPIRDTFVVMIDFSSPSPEIASLVTNGVVDAYIQRNLEVRFQEVKKVSDWMNQSLGGIATQLESSEQKLQQFRSSEDLVDIKGKGTSSFLSSRIEELSSQLIKERIAFNQLKVLKRQADRFKKMTLAELLNNPSIYKHPTLSDLKNKEVESGRLVNELEKRYGTKHPKMKQARTQLDTIRNRYRELIPSILRGIDEDFEVSKENLASLDIEYNSVKKELQQSNVTGFALERLQQDVEGNRKLRDLFMEEYKQTSLNQSFETDRARVVDAAEVPMLPSKPNKRRIIIISMLLALFAGIGLAFLIDYLDLTIKTSEDIERKLRLPTLGLLPELDSSKIKSGEIKPERVYTDDESSNFSETIRTIRTGITLSSLDKPHKVILCTSAVPGEGKTTVACNLALSLSQLERTLIFDADLRRPSTKKIFGHDHHSAGMSDLLAEKAEFKDVIHKVEGTKLHVIVAGTIPPDPLDLLASKKFHWLLDELSKRYDRIIIDSPPVQLVSDAVLLSSLVDAVVFVTKADDTNVKVVESSVNKLRQTNANIIGAVLNNVDIKKMSKYYGYGYGKYYGSGYYSYGEEYKNS